MSIVVAVINLDTGERAIGADRAVVGEGIQIVSDFPKVMRYGSGLIGFVGDIQTIQKVMHSLNNSGKTLAEEFASHPAKIWDLISALVVTGDSITEYSDSGVIEISPGSSGSTIIGCIGAAHPIAYGAAFASVQSGHVPLTNVRLALEASAEYCPGISKETLIIADNYGVKI